MSDPHNNSPSKYHHLLSCKSLHVGNIEVLSSLSSICGDEHIKRLENNNQKGLWCNVILQGIKVTKALALVIGTKCIHIKRYRDSIDQAYLSITRTYR